MKIDDFKGLLDSAWAVRLDAVSELTLNYLLVLAEKEMKSCPAGEGMQCITALMTEHDKIFIGITSGLQDGSQLIDKMKQDGETQVTHLVTLVQGGRGAGDYPPLDVCDYGFRKRLLELNEKNAFALMLLQGQECLVARTVESTMPAKKTDE